MERGRSALEPTTKRQSRVEVAAAFRAAVARNLVEEAAPKAYRALTLMVGQALDRLERAEKGEKDVPAVGREHMAAINRVLDMTGLPREAPKEGGRDLASYTAAELAKIIQEGEARLKEMRSAPIIDVTPREGADMFE